MWLDNDSGDGNIGKMECRYSRTPKTRTCDRSIFFVGPANAYENSRILMSRFFDNSIVSSVPCGFELSRYYIFDARILTKISFIMQFSLIVHSCRASYNMNLCFLITIYAIQPLSMINDFYSL